MKMERILMTENEKFARSMSDGNIVSLNKDQDLDNIIKNEAKNKFNDKIQEIQKRMEEHSKLLDQYREEVTKDINNMDMSPVYNYIIIKPYEENPFQQIKKEGSIIIDSGGLTPIYKSQEDGEIHEEESYVHTGMVTAVGPECKYIKEGDIVMWTKNSEVPIPFYKEGLVLVNETRIMIRVRESEIFKKEQ